MTCDLSGSLNRAAKRDCAKWHIDERHLVSNPFIKRNLLDPNRVDVADCIRVVFGHECAGRIEKSTAILPNERFFKLDENGGLLDVSGRESVLIPSKKLEEIKEALVEALGKSVEEAAPNVFPLNVPERQGGRWEPQMAAGIPAPRAQFE